MCIFTVYFTFCVFILPFQLILEANVVHFTLLNLLDNFRNELLCINAVLIGYYL